MLNVEGVLVLGFKKKAVFLTWRVFLLLPHCAESFSRTHLKYLSIVRPKKKLHLLQKLIYLLIVQPGHDL